MSETQIAAIWERLKKAAPNMLELITAQPVRICQNIVIAGLILGSNKFQNTVIQCQHILYGDSSTVRSSNLQHPRMIHRGRYNTKKVPT